MKHKEPIIESAELNDLCAKVMETGNDMAMLAEEVQPSWFFADNQCDDATDIISFLVINKVKLPQIVELTVKDECGIIWSLMSESKIEATLNKVVEDQRLEREDWALQSAKTTVKDLEAQLVCAKTSLALSMKAKGSKTK